MSEETFTVSVWRGDDEVGRYQDYEVPRMESQTVLDVITYIQRRLDPNLSYRFACRVGVCGSCAMTVNGKPRWTCRTHVSKVIEDGRLEVAPLRNLKVIKDLSVDMTDFFDKWAKAEARFVGGSTRHDDFAKVSPDDKRRQEASAGIECIGCGVCYATCDVVAWNTEYLGPAALNRAWTLINDERDTGRLSRLKAVSGTGGCQACHSQQGCVERCPKHLNPTASIAGLKRATAMAALKGELK
ncbi:MAG: succinate dehydrogenase/fumarate reductase iron-sulfur subunit [Rhodospirillaceae bacterium]|nr:succinate dehydrogenase/fumarate reductase iron-sulfur subunit [Rhodospirillaceae bacterium]